MARLDLYQNGQDHSDYPLHNLVNRLLTHNNHILSNNTSHVQTLPRVQVHNHLLIHDEPHHRKMGYIRLLGNSQLDHLRWVHPYQHQGKVDQDMMDILT
jgi:hypothetical protein